MKSLYSKSLISSYSFLPINLLINLFSGVLLIRHLNQSDYGSLKLVGSIGLLIGFLTSFGLESTLHRFLSELINLKSYRSALKIFKVGLLIRISSLVIVFTGLYVFSGIIFKWLQFAQELQSMYLFIILYLSLIQVEGYFFTITQIYLENYKIKILQLIKNIMRLIFVICIVEFGLGFTHLIFSMLFISFFGFCVAIILAILKLKKWDTNQKDLAKIKSDEMISYAGYSYFGMSIGMFKQMAMDNFFISSFIGSESVAIYGYSSQLVNYLRMLNPFSILRDANNSLLLNIYSKNKDYEILNDYYRFVNKVYFFFLSPVLILLCLLFAPITKYIFNPNYILAQSTFLILVFSYFIGDLVYCFNAIIYVLKKPKIHFYANFFSLYNILMNLILIEIYGLNGIAFATGSTVVLIYLYYIIVFKKLVSLKLKIPFFSIFKIFINLIPMLVFLFFYGRFSDNVLNLIMVTGISILLYLLMCMKNKIFSKKEKRKIESLFGKNLWFI